MKKVLLLLLGCMVLWPVYAERAVPMDFSLYRIRAVQDPMILVEPPSGSWLRWVTLGLIDNASQLKMSVALRIRDQNNRYIVRNKLPEFRKQVIAVRYDTMKQVNEIWILTPVEVARFKQALIEKEAGMPYRP